MKNKKRLHFGVIFSTMDNTNQYDIWNGIVKYARKNDIHLTAYFGTYQMTVNDFASHFETCFETVRNSVSLDGVIMFSGFIAHIIGNENFEKYAAKIPKHLPIVSVSYVMPGVPSVIVDNITGMYSAVDHLIQFHGKKHIAFVKGPDGHPEAEDRLEGYKRALAANGIPFDERYIFPGNFDQDSGRNAVKKLLNMPDLSADAITASNDVSAIGILSELKNSNLMAPADFAVTGFDDDKISAAFIPSISTARQDFHQFGLISAEMLFNQIIGKPVEDITYVPPVFVARQSCGCLAEEFLNTEPGDENGHDGHDDQTDADSLISYASRKFISLFKQNVPEPQINKWVDTLIETIKENPFSKEKFLSLLNENLISYNQYSKDIIIWNEALNILMTGAELYGGEVECLHTVRSTLTYASTFVHSIRFKEKEFKEIALKDNRWKVRRVASNLVLIFDIDSLAEELYKSLPGISITTAIIGLYHNPIKSGVPNADRTIDTLIGFDGNKKFDVKNNAGSPILFSDYSTIENFDFENGRHDLFFIPLFFKDEEFGVMLMPFDPNISVDTYETLRVNISTAVKGAVLIKEIKYQNDLLNAVNDAAAILLDPDVEKFEENVVDAMGVVGKAVNASRMYIWKNHMTGSELSTTMLHEWRVSEELKVVEEIRVNLPYRAGFTEWKNTLSNGECINNFVRERPESERGFLSLLKIMSLVVAPVILNNQFWGFVGFDDHLRERRFSENEEIVLRYVGKLLVNALLRQNMAINLQATLKQANEASKAKSDFLANMSHEMRTPMNAVIGMTAIGKKAKDPEEKDYALNKIGDASSHLLGVINDILDMSKIEANKLELSPTEFNFDRMLQKVVTVVNFRVEEKKQALFVNVDEKIPRFIVGDEQRLAQVITNLLSNAVKFTPESGEIHLETALIGRTDEDCELRISVADSGIGISPEQQERLFQAFEQADSGTNRKYGGTGLGLVISKNIIELMGGRIWIESELGKGAKFIFTIKVSRGERNSGSLLAHSVKWETVRVLAVDDMPETREQFQNIFSQLNIKCDAASDGLEACRMIEERGGYDVYFIDWLMPNMDGIELTRQIKSRNNGRPSVVIMITAMDWEQIKDEATRAGVDKHLLKPLFTSTIIDCINECFGKDQVPAGDAEYIIGEFKGKRLLLAEDVEINREILISLLEDTGIIIDCAENGREALEMIETSAGKYDIVFMDVQMPIMDGYEATRAIRALPAMQGVKLPIIAMTANVFKSDIEESFAAGMDEHLRKPIDFERVLKVLRKYL